jgi:hypothetical protein
MPAVSGLVSPPREATRKGRWSSFMQHPFVEKPKGNRPVTIAVDGEPLGIVVPDPHGVRFLAVRFNAFGIDGQIFPNAEAAQLAATEAVAAAD